MPQSTLDDCCKGCNGRFVSDGGSCRLGCRRWALHERIKDRKYKENKVESDIRDYDIIQRTKRISQRLRKYGKVNKRGGRLND